MSQENAAVVEAAWNAFRRDGLDALAAYWTEDIDHRAIEGAPDDRGPMHGRDAMRAYLQDWLDTFDDVRTDIVELIDAGEDKVIAVLRLSGRAKLSGIETELTYAVVYTIRDGKIARGREYATRTRPSKPPGCRGRSRVAGLYAGGKGRRGVHSGTSAKSGVIRGNQA
jgi:ketosteroid isomerase-like protein